jgi:hypothetical protein
MLSRNHQGFFISRVGFEGTKSCRFSNPGPDGELGDAVELDVAVGKLRSGQGVKIWLPEKR